VRFLKLRRIHFVGAGGVGMSGLAEILLLSTPLEISGCDRERSENTERLTALGAKIAYGHDASHLDFADLVVISSAISEGNPEVGDARRRGIPVIRRAEMLAEIMRLKQGVAVAGTHGKTTTTSMVGVVLAEGHLDPTIVVGGRVSNLGSNARLGQGDYLVAEADESDGSFLKLAPTIAVVTTIDAEHLDHYGSLEAIGEAFLAFVNKVPFYGSAVLCLDEPNIQRLLPRVDKRVITYGLESGADLVARRLQLAGMTSRFDVYQRGALLGECALQIPGRHNVLNALAAIGVGLDLEIPFVTITRALAGFAGVQRRFQIRGTAGGVTVIDDYGHHPAEIRATLAAAKAGFDSRVVTVFQPHRYTRTRDLKAEFLTAFNQADVLVMMDIYAAGEPPIPGVSAEDLAEGIRAHGHRNVTFLGSDRARIVQYVTEISRPGDLIVTLGAGDVTHLGPDILRQLEAESPNGTEERNAR
jgi:UDP-N-acetylmuramate--alanine ligase